MILHWIVVVNIVLLDCVIRTDVIVGYIVLYCDVVSLEQTKQKGIREKITSWGKVDGLLWCGRIYSKSCYRIDIIVIVVMVMMVVAIVVVCGCSFSNARS